MSDSGPVFREIDLRGVAQDTDPKSQGGAMTEKLKLKRLSPGVYETPDGKYTIQNDPSVLANMWGDFSRPWELEERRGIKSHPLGTYATLRDARAALTKYLEAKSKKSSEGA